MNNKFNFPDAKRDEAECKRFIEGFREYGVSKYRAKLVKMFIHLRRRLSNPICLYNFMYWIQQVIADRGEKCLEIFMDDISTVHFTL